LVFYCARNGEGQRIRADFPKGNEEEREVDNDGLDGVGREEVPGDDEADEVEEEGEQDSEPGADGGEEEEGETEEESSSGEERPPPGPS
jgi:hypothetical protein